MVDVAGARVLAILTRAPSSGGKRRLFAALGCPPDPALLTALLLDTLDGAAVAGVRRVVAVTPAASCGEVAALVPRDVAVIPQAEGDLGMRMGSAFTLLFARGATAVAIIGSDLPDIDGASVRSAFERLADDPESLVLGPAVDGGYYLIGSTRVPPVFEGIEWGSARVLEQTVKAASAAGLRVSLLTVAADVDRPDDLRRVAGRGSARRTAAWVLEMERRKDGKKPSP
jgi:hypothetical protein